MTQQAVFVRNHQEYLDHACDIGEQDPNRPVTFRSAKKWATASKALASQEAVRVYFSANGAGGQVGYIARLLWTVTDPKKGDPETEKALKHQLPETVNESLWDTEEVSVRTLYVISRCRRLEAPFSLAELRKASDGSYLSASYGYSYVPVHELEHEVGFVHQPEEVSVDIPLVEGAVKKVSVNAYERNSAARKACIDHYGYRCAACSMSFEERYGELGREFIHVHHVVSLASLKASYTVDPVVDLRPLCPNCHAMVHRSEPPLGVGELAKLIQQ